MSRRRYREVTPPPLDVSMIGSVLDSLSEREANIVIATVILGTPTRVICNMYGITPEQMREIKRRTMLKLQHTSRARVIENEWSDQQWTLFSPDLRRQIAELTQCAPPPCEQCGVPMDWPPAPDRGGRPRTYCSSACRQKAYRLRLSQPAGE